MKIEILYFEGCPGAEPTRALVERVLTEERGVAAVEMIEINDPEMARARQFLQQAPR